MNINVGSTNETKLNAVKEVIAMYDFLSNANVVSVKVPSGVSEQPKSLEETIIGAQNRARKAFQDCAYSIGLESGLMYVPYVKAGYVDIGVCVIYDGKEFHHGFSPAFEPPKEVVKHVLIEKVDLSQAAYRAGLTEDLKIGAGEGLTGILTKRRINRLEQLKPAIIYAMIGVERAREK